ncbi:MAG: aminopeptidase [Pseudomonadota bacterium]
MGAIVLLLCFNAGCTSVAYYGQATRGHLSILAQRQSLEDVITDSATPDAVKEKLKLVREIRKFASDSLLLPENNSYQSYVDLKRRYVVWNVFAAPALSLQPIESCFVIVGCLSYRGYYAKEDAEAFAEQLRQDGHDVYLGGVAAYSTLGWFDDPVLNTMLYWDDRRLARLIFHELTHQLLYVKDDAKFNESFATSFAEIGLQRWLINSSAAQTEDVNELLRKDKAREIDFIEILQHTQHRLKDIYASSSPSEDKFRDKQAAFAALLVDYEQFKQRWNGYAGYDDWMTKDLNNAKIASVATYHSYDDAFQHILNNVDNDIARFLNAVRAIAALDQDARHRCLRELTANKDYQCGT